MNADVSTKVFTFEVTHTYEVEAYNVLQAYDLIKHINVTTNILSSGTIHIGRRSKKKIAAMIKRHGQQDFTERPDFFLNEYASCTSYARLKSRPDDQYTPLVRIKYMSSK